MTAAAPTGGGAAHNNGSYGANVPLAGLAAVPALGAAAAEVVALELRIENLQRQRQREIEVLQGQLDLKQLHAKIERLEAQRDAAQAEARVAQAAAHATNQRATATDEAVRAELADLKRQIADLSSASAVRDGDAVSCIFTQERGRDVRYFGRVDLSAILVKWDDHEDEDGGQSQVPLRSCRRERNEGPRPRRPRSGGSSSAAAAAETEPPSKRRRGAFFCTLCQDDHSSCETEQEQLSCGHVFCKDGLDGWARSENQGRPKRRLIFSCPVCRRSQEQV